MNFKKFSGLYNAQLKIGSLLNTLSEIEYHNQSFFRSIEREALSIASKLGNGYFSDAHWLNTPLSAEDAFYIYNKQVKLPF